MHWIPLILIVAVTLAVSIFMKRNFKLVAVIALGGLILTSAITGIDYFIQTHDTEVWSGSVIDWKHKEEWTEWIPPVTTCSTDSEGRQSCTTIPGYFKHHPAENHIKTSDSGWIYVSKAPDGKKFTDKWPNDDKVLREYWKEGSPTASVHSYVNKVNASYSIYRHEDVSIEDYPNLPDYPNKVRDKFHVDRIIGVVPNKEEAIEALAAQNTRLNEFIPDPEKEGKMRSWKQVNMIFVNVGKDENMLSGYALQDLWRNGSKNDFIVTFSMNEDGKLNWAYPFSWSEVELLKLEVRDYMMDLEQVEDFVVVVDEVAKLVEDKFERKEFADFNYLQIEVSSGANIFIWFVNLMLGGLYFYMVFVSRIDW